MKASIVTLGCKVNQYESQTIAASLEGAGYEIVPDTQDADIFVVNSCTVTAESDRKTRQTVRHLKSRHSNSVVVLTGCMPQVCEGLQALLPEADIILGNNSNESIVSALNTYFSAPAPLLMTKPHVKSEPFSGITVNAFRGRTRANVKIEDGCNRFCSYCIIPYARGRVRSKPLALLREELKALECAGFREVVLVGINLSAYSDGESNLCDAVEAAAKFDGISRVRLGSLEPDHLTDEIVGRLSKCKKLCPQFHISLQSGCDKTLKMMNRHYTAAEYLDLCKKLRGSFDECTLTTDVMVGFPGESDGDFSESLSFVRRVGFEKVHVFPYSRRAGTPAAKMDGQISNLVKQHRARAMLDAAAEIRHSFLMSQIGKTVEVLIEEHNEGAHEGAHEGFTANYTPVKVNGDCPDSGLVKAKIIDVQDDFCIASCEVSV